MTHVVRVRRAAEETVDDAIARDTRGPWFVEERGVWWFRGAQDAAGDGGGQWLRVHELPGQRTRIAPFDSPAMTFVPGTGCLHRLGIVDPDETGCSVVLVGPFDGHPAASIEARVPFDAVRIDDQPWSAFTPDGRILLPQRDAERVRVDVQTLQRDPGPLVWSTDADLRVCRYDREAKTLELVCEPVPGHDDVAPYFAVISGTPPRSVDGLGAVLDASATGPVPVGHERADAFVLRFRPGRVVLRYDGPGTGLESDGSPRD